MNITQAATDLVFILQQKGFEALFVGGAVRDSLLGIPINDIDIATNASASDVEAIFPKTIPVGIKFGIVIVIHHGMHFEVATFRQDKDYEDGRHPVGYIPSTKEQDVLRRDFTINGLYLNPVTHHIFDFIEGQKDLKQRLIRAIGDPKKRFQEDRLRMIRAARYAAVLNFSIDDPTKEAIINMAPSCLEGLSIERIYQELDKMHQKGALCEGLKILYELNLLTVLFKQLEPLSSQTLLQRIERTQALKYAPLVFSLLILFDIHDEASAIFLIKSLKMSNAYLKMALDAIAFSHYSQFTNYKMAQYLALPYVKDITLYQSVYEKDKALFEAFVDDKNVQLKPIIDRIIHKDPLVKAQDLIDLGFEKGPRLKELLEKSMELHSDHVNWTKDEIIKNLIL